MKKFIFFVFVLLFGLHVYAEHHKRHVSTYIGFRMSSFIAFGYGQSLYKEGVYLGFVESIGTIGTVGIGSSFSSSVELAYLSLGYGYEFFRDHRFSFGLNILGEGGIAKKVKGGWTSSLHGSLGSFARFKITPKWSCLLKLEKPFGANQTTLANTLSIAVGLRYSF